MQPEPTLPSISHSDLQGRDIADVRAAIRAGQYTRHTAGLGRGLLQCNLVILPADYASDFVSYCAANSQACPLVGVSEPGAHHMPEIGKTINLRTDVPRYNIYRDGVLDTQVIDLLDLWQDDWVTFALGCSFTFERALIEAGIAMRHVEQDRTVPMYHTNRQTVVSGAFGGGMVVSMRPIPRDEVERAKAISARYPLAHGAPVHVGDPAVLGIDDLAKPHWGDTLDVLPGEVPVFWACGVTPQVAIRQARPAICVTHAPGSMLITDLDEFHGAANAA
ncbi:MAG: putative hydro-lyase [Devosiaceae bacterium]